MRNYRANMEEIEERRKKCQEDENDRVKGAQREFMRREKALRERE